MALSPTQHTLNHFRKQGYIAQVTEHWNAHARIRQDLFGFVDVIAVGPTGEIIFAQATIWDNTSARLRKILDDPVMRSCAFRLCLRNSVAVVGWKQQGGKGSLWVGKWRYLVPQDFCEEVPEWKPTTEPTEHSDDWYEQCVLPNVPSLRVHDPRSGGSPNAGS